LECRKFFLFLLDKKGDYGRGTWIWEPGGPTTMVEWEEKEEESARIACTLEYMLVDALT
jgi:hypothetical protein